jgi:serine/threonine protein kinase
MVLGRVSGTSYEVERFLGGEGAGEVYRANLGGEPVALKWYFPNQATLEQRESLETLMRIGAPSKKFLWPTELTSAEGVPGFGYITPLRESRYIGIVDMMKGRVEPTFRALTTAGTELSECILHLHVRGLCCYPSLELGSFAFDSSSGEVVIPHAWFVLDGTAKKDSLGTPRFLAPEVLRGEAPPSISADLHSLAVLLFYMFMLHHPLEGKKESSITCFDAPAMTKFYGTEPVFIFDSNDRSNEPVAGHHDNAIALWPIYPKFLRDAFTRAFTQGVRDPNGRVSANEWRAAMVRLRDSILYCRCESENFYDAEALRASGGKPGPCWSCKKEIQLPARIRIGKNVVMLNHDTQLFPHHLDEKRMYDFSRPVAEMKQHPTNLNVWGLKNISDEKWVSKLSDGTVKDVEPGQSVSLATGTKILFETSEGEIRASGRSENREEELSLVTDTRR